MSTQVTAKTADFGEIGNNDEVVATFDFLGASEFDRVGISFGFAGPPSGCIVKVWVSAADQIAVGLFNATTAPLSIGSLAFEIITETEE